MNTEVLVSTGSIGASNDIGILRRLPQAHALQRDGDPRGKRMAEQQMGAFVSEHNIDGTEIHVREEYGLGGRHRIYVMTASERVRDQAEFMDFDGLNFN